MVYPDRRRLALVALLLSGAAWIEPAPARSEAEAIQLARGLAAVGPRVPGSRGHSGAVRLLLAAMESAGLGRVAAHPVGTDSELRLLEGVLPGESGLEVVLSAHLDTVPGTPGAADDAAGCAVVLATAARLSQLPRRHRVRVLFFDGEESGHRGSTAWAESLSAETRRGILAAVNVDLVGWDPAARGTVLTLLPRSGSRRGLAPGWLVATTLEAARSVGAPTGVASASASALGQVLARAFRMTLSSDAEPLLASGLPAITLSDSDIFRADPKNHRPEDAADRLDAASLERWVDRLSALVLRLDTLAGRPRDDDQYLALGGRVWSRRALYWIGLGVWMVLVFQGLPGAWRGIVGAERRRRGRTYLPGFAVRVLYLGSVLMLPVFTIVVLMPAAVLATLPARWLPVRSRPTFAAVPALLLLAALSVLVSRDRVEGLALGLPAIALLISTLAALLWLNSSQSDQRARASSARVDTADSHSSTEL